MVFNIGQILIHLRASYLQSGEDVIRIKRCEENVFQ
jgi:hypothetical protein